MQKYERHNGGSKNYNNTIYIVICKVLFRLFAVTIYGWWPARNESKYAWFKSLIFNTTLLIITSVPKFTTKEMFPIRFGVNNFIEWSLNHLNELIISVYQWDLWVVLFTSLNKANFKAILAWIIDSCDGVHVSICRISCFTF